MDKEIKQSDRKADERNETRAPASVSELRCLYEEEQMTLQEIADRYSVSRQAVHERLTRAGVRTRPRGRPRTCSIDKELLQRLYIVEQRSLQWIAGELGTSPYFVRSELVRCGIEIRSGAPPAADIERRQLLKLYITDGLTQREIAAKLGVDVRTIAKALRRYKIEFRHPRGVPPRRFNREELHQLYIVENLSSAAIGKKFGVCGEIIRRALKHHGINVRSPGRKRIDKGGGKRLHRRNAPSRVIV